MNKAADLKAAADQAQVEGNWALAETALKTLARLDPRSLSAALGLSGLRALQGDSKGAERWLEKARKLDARSVVDPTDRFRALMILERFEAAFRVAEEILDRGVDLRDIRTFWNPWRHHPIDDRRAAMIAALDRLCAGARAPWPFFYKGALSPDAEARASFAQIPRYPKKRYGWMNLRGGTTFLIGGEIEKGMSLLSLSLAQPPVDWTARGYRAEGYLCLKKPTAAVREMERAELEAPEGERAWVAGWRGAVLLWSGRYAKAFAVLDDACRRGAQHAYCWRAAAKLKLGDLKDALALLDETVARFPVDEEARLWRGEALRLSGRNEEAARELSLAERMDWARWNRALVYEEIGETALAERDFASLPRDAVAFVRRKLGIAGTAPLTAARRRRVLREGLKRAGGWRRNEYNQRIWID